MCGIVGYVAKTARSISHRGLHRLDIGARSSGVVTIQPNGNFPLKTAGRIDLLATKARPNAGRGNHRYAIPAGPLTRAERRECTPPRGRPASAGLWRTNE